MLRDPQVGQVSHGLLSAGAGDSNNRGSDSGLLFPLARSSLPALDRFRTSMVTVSRSTVTSMRRPTVASAALFFVASFAAGTPRRKMFIPSFPTGRRLATRYGFHLNSNGDRTS
jgi:hypothetical protein